MKKLIALLMALFVITMLFAGCGQQAAEETNAVEQTENVEAVDQAEEAELPEWISLDEAGILVLTLPEEEGSGYSWQMDFSDEAVAELLTCTDETGDFVASFRGLEDGSCIISMTYACGEALAYAYHVEVVVEGGMITEVASSDYVELEGVQEITVAPELQKLRSDNEVAAVLAQHSSMTVVTENWVVEDGVETYAFMNVEQFWMEEDGRLLHIHEQTNAESEFSYCGEHYLGEGIPSGFYSYDAEDGSKTLMMLVPEEYESNIYSEWMTHTIDLDEELVGYEETEEYENITISTVVRNDGAVVCEYDYFVDSQTGLLTGMECRYFDLSTGEQNGIARTNVLYDQPRELEHRAVENLIVDENYCLLTMVFEPGTDRETNYVYQVSQEAMAFLYSELGYLAYEDEACTVEKDVIDLMQAEETIYVTAKN